MRKSEILTNGLYNEAIKQDIEHTTNEMHNIGAKSFSLD